MKEVVSGLLSPYPLLPLLSFYRYTLWLDLYIFFGFGMRWVSFFGAALATYGVANAQTQYTSTKAADVAAARATAKTLSPTSNVKGKTFDRFVTIFLENTDFNLAAGDGTFQHNSPSHTQSLTPLT